MKIYKRYMVLCSDEYDNPDPCDCMELSTDDKSKALAYDGDGHRTSVCDRVEGYIIRKWTKEKR